MKEYHTGFDDKAYLNISDLHTRQYYLIQFITFECLIVCLLIVPLYTFAKLWYLVAVISTGGILALLNLGILIYSKNTLLCGHLTTLIVFLTVLIANYFVRGIGSTYSVWFYVVPLLAVALVGRTGLFIYSTFSFLFIIACRVFSIPAYYSLSLAQLAIIDWLNHLFGFIIIVTTLDSFVRVSNRYEQLLTNKNYSLQLEKNKYHLLAWFDELTNLPNRQYFKFNLEAIITSLPPDHCVTVFFMDLDNLKYINDDLGHDAGDHLLLEVARRLKTCFRQKDFVARLGGDEFTAIVVHARDEEISQLISKRIKQDFKQAFQFKNKKYYSSISIGLATYPNDAKTIDDLMAIADQAMYAAKKEREKLNLLRD